jgi:DNA-binding Lrp family transcriptional regulator
VNPVDDLDHKLLALLSADARVAVATLAARLGVARATVANRMARLEAEGIIGGYTVRLTDAAARRQITALVMINVDAKLGERVVAALRKMPAVASLKAISGIYDLAAEVRAETTEEIDRILDEIGKLPGIAHTTSSIVLSTKFSR